MPRQSWIAQSPSTTTQGIRLVELERNFSWRKVSETKKVGDRGYREIHEHREGKYCALRKDKQHYEQTQSIGNSGEQVKP